MKLLCFFTEFDEKVKRSKAEAEEAMKKIRLIEDYINEAEGKTLEARDNLADAEKDAIAAKEYAEQAQILAEKANIVSMIFIRSTLK